MKNNRFFNKFKLLTFRLQNIKNKEVTLNISWLVVDKIFRISLSFFVGVYVARYLGPDNFGMINYAIALVGILGSFASGGLSDISIKEIIRGGNKNLILGSIFWLQLILSTFVILPIIAIAYLPSRSSPEESLIILIIGLSLIFQSNINVKIWFESQLKSKYIVISENAIAILICLAKIVLVIFKADLTEFAFLILIESMFSYLLLLILYYKKVGPPSNWMVNFSTCKNLLIKSYPVILSSTAIALYMRIDTVILAYLTNYTAIGEYTAALRLSEVWYIAPMVFANSLYPGLIKINQINNLRYLLQLQKIFNISVNLAILVAIIISINSHEIVRLIYGEQYKNASLILNIHIWTCVFVFMGIFSSKHYVISNLQHLSAFRTIYGLGINIVLNFILIPFYGVTGSAVATLVSFFLVDYLFDYFNIKTREIFLMKSKAFLFLPVFIFKSILR